MTDTPYDHLIGKYLAFRYVPHVRGGHGALIAEVIPPDEDYRRYRFVGELADEQMYTFWEEDLVMPSALELLAEAAK